MDCGLLQTHHSQRIHHNSSTIPKFPAHVPAHPGRRLVENTKAFYFARVGPRGESGSKSYFCPTGSCQYSTHCSWKCTWRSPFMKGVGFRALLSIGGCGDWEPVWKKGALLSMPHQRRGRRPSFPQMKPTRQSHCRSFRELAIGCFLIHDNNGWVGNVEKSQGKFSSEMVFTLVENQRVSKWGSQLVWKGDKN